MEIANPTVEACCVDPRLERLLSLIAEVPQAVSQTTLSKILQIEISSELHKELQNTITTKCQNAFKLFWHTNQVSEKLNKLRELEVTCPKEPAWRPTTGHVDENAITAHYLLKKKEELQKFLDNLEEESANLKSYLKNFHKETEHQLGEIQAIKQTYKNNKNCSKSTE